jgi:hypothetical protein
MIEARKLAINKAAGKPFPEISASTNAILPALISRKS